MRWLGLSLALCAMGITAGCGGSDEPSLVPVSGTVTLDGKPLAGALVEFIPLDPKQPQTAGGGTTDPAGKYTAMYRGSSGLSPGKYKVNVRKDASPDASKVAAGGQQDPYMAKLGAEALNAEAIKSDIKADKSIKAEFNKVVEAAGSTVDLDVKGSGPQK